MTPAQNEGVPILVEIIFFAMNSLSKFERRGFINIKKIKIDIIFKLVIYCVESLTKPSGHTVH